VDADACPVKDEVVRVATRHGLAVHMVSNRAMRLPAGSLVRAVVVGDDADAADHWIAEHIGPGDIAVTTDIPLAARCLAAGAGALSPTGKPFTNDNIGAAVAMRELMGHLRDAEVVRGGGPGFTPKDRSRFLGALEEAVRAAGR